MKVITIIQARTTSSRLPNKALLDIFGKSLLERVIDQAKSIRLTDEVWVATSQHENDDLIEILCDRVNVNCYRGSLDDVRSRFFHLAEERNGDLIVRITADNPLTEPEYADQLISFLKENRHYDYARIAKDKVIDGSNSEVFTKTALEKSINKYSDPKNMEHVTPAMIEDMNLIELTPDNKDLITKKAYFAGVDTFEDLLHLTKIYKRLGETKTLNKLIQLLNEHKKTV
jgi:spore coat polysaccharide biosynthesis protein SpsF